MGLAAAISLGICLICIPFMNSAEAGRSSMSGDYVNDTVSVAQNLQEIIEVPQDAQGKSEAVALITDYISRYRNRSQVNGTMSFTTMQTAGNSLAGHYKTFPNRPLPDGLKNRLNDELTKAQDLASKNS